MNFKITNKKIIPSMVLGLGLAVGLATNTQSVQASTTHRPKTHTVKKGECFWTIAQKYKMSVKHLEAINGMHDETVIHPKDKLKLRGKEKPVVYEKQAETVSYQEPVENQTVAQSQASAVAESQTQVQEPVASDTSSAKEWIAQRESGGSYTAVNPSSGTYGRYQLTPDKLNGDYSPANQERVAQKYVNERYGGSWDNAKAFWLAHGWY